MMQTAVKTFFGGLLLAAEAVTVQAEKYADEASRFGRRSRRSLRESASGLEARARRVIENPARAALGYDPRAPLRQLDATCADLTRELPRLRRGARCKPIVPPPILAAPGRGPRQAAAG